MKPLVTAALLLIASTAAWTVVMALDASPRPATAVIAMAVSLWTAAVASVSGMMISRSRWARRTGLALAAAHGVIAVIWPVDGWWMAAAGLSAAAAISVSGPWLRGIVRSLPAAAGPPARAVLVPLLILAVPFVGGALGGDGAWFAIAALAALGAGFWFIRTWTGALVAVRIGWPLVALSLAWPIGGAAGVAVAALGVTVSVVAWDESVTRSVIPLVERGSLVPIPPELAPGDVLDAAGIDDRGRRL